VDKSYVTLEQRVCQVCGVTYDTGSILMDTLIIGGKLRKRFDRHTVVGWGMCEEHQTLADQDYIALVEATGPANARILNVENANRTGNICHIRREVADIIFNPPIDSELNMVFIEPGVIEKLQSMQGGDTDEEDT
jgi:hypothetical protein